MKIKILVPIISLLLFASCQRKFEKEVQSRINKYKQIGLQNYKLEKTTKPAIKAYFTSQPSYPYYKDVMALRDKFEEYNEKAKAFSPDDKVRHCYIGHVVAQKHQFKTAIFIGFYKEAQDVGDGKKSTHFEVPDRDATTHGARLYKRKKSINECHKVRNHI